MKRRSFLKFLGIGAAAPIAVKAAEELPKALPESEVTEPEIEEADVEDHAYEIVQGTCAFSVDFCASYAPAPINLKTRGLRRRRNR